MTFITKERATAIAAELNMRRGYPPARVYAIVGGWTVVCSWHDWNGAERI